MSEDKKLAIRKDRNNGFLSFIDYCFSENRTQLLFIVTILVSVIAFLLVCCIRGDAYYTYYFYANEEVADTFMDFFNSIRDASQGIECYTQRGVIYPPLANLFFLFCSRFTYTEGNNTIFVHRLEILDSPVCFIIYLVTCVVFVSILVAALTRYSFKGKELKFATVILSIINAPFLFLFERGNIVLAAYVFTLIFVLFYDHKQKHVRVLACVALVLAAGIKLYPAVFGILLLTDKRYKDAIKTAIAGVLIIVVPFVSFGYEEGMIAWVKNIARFSSAKGAAASFVDLNSFKGLIYIGQTVLHAPFDISGLLNIALTVIPVLLGLGAAFILPKKWQKLIALAVAMFNIPGCSGHYSVVFLLIPMFVMMCEEKLDKRDYIYFALMLPIFAFYITPIYINDTTVSVNRLLSSGFISLVFIGLMIRTVIEIVKIVKKERPLIIPASKEIDTISEVK